MFQAICFTGVRRALNYYWIIAELNTAVVGGQFLFYFRQTTVIKGVIFFHFLIFGKVFVKKKKKKKKTEKQKAVVREMELKNGVPSVKIIPPPRQLQIFWGKIEFF